MVFLRLEAGRGIQSTMPAVYMDSMGDAERKSFPGRFRSHDQADEGGNRKKKAGEPRMGREQTAAERRASDGQDSVQIRPAAGKGQERYTGKLAKRLVKSRIMGLYIPFYMLYWD